MFRNLVCMALSALIFFPLNFASAQDEANIREELNRGTVSIITGATEHVSNTDMPLVSEMADVLDERNELRVLRVIGSGSVQNVRDLLYLKGIDIAMVHSDVFTYLQQRNLYPTAEQKLRYIVNLYDELFHVVARQDIRDVKQLSGKKVVVGKPNSGSETSAHTLFTILGVKPVYVHYDWKTALEKVRSGEAAAMVYPTPKPSRFLQQTDGEGLHFLELPFNKELLKTYYPTVLSSKDYPNLVPPGQQVETLQFGALMAVYNWQSKTQRYAKVSKFVERFLDNLDNFKKPSRHPRWQKLDINSTLPGWKRYQPVQDWLAANARRPAKARQSGDSGDPVTKQFEGFLAYMRSKGGQSDAKGDELIKMFKEFQEWQKRSPPKKGVSPPAQRRATARQPVEPPIQIQEAGQ